MAGQHSKMTSKFRKLIGPGKTSSERGRTEMTFATSEYARVCRSITETESLEQFRCSVQLTRRAGKEVGVLSFSYMGMS